MKIEKGRVNPQLVAELQGALGTPLTQAALIQLLYGESSVSVSSAKDLATEPGLQREQHPNGGCE